MATEVSYTQARATLAKLLDTVSKDREIVIIKRRKGSDTAIIAADELNSLLESIYLLRSPANAERLQSALNRALRREGQPMSIDDLRREVGVDS